MWNMFIVAAMAALTGVYMLPAERSQITIQNQQARELAESMGVYRQAVVAYFSANNVTDTSVDINTLKNAGLLPAWSTLYTRSTTPLWANYRDSSGAIYIYPAAPLSTNIATEVLQLSHNSMNVGTYRASDSSLCSPLDGTCVALASLGAVPVPDSALVWMAASN